MSFRNKILTWESLPAWRAHLRRSALRLVVTNGCFDLLHVGHAIYLESARALGDRLLVGVNSDASVRHLKGTSRPIHHEDDRAALIAALGCVDAVCLFQECSANALLELTQPDLWAKGGDYTLETVNQIERATVERAGGQVVILERVPGRSSTSILKRSEVKAITAIPGSDPFP